MPQSSLLPIPACLVCRATKHEPPSNFCDDEALETLITRDDLNCVNDLELSKHAPEQEAELSLLENTYKRLEETLAELQRQAACMDRRRKVLRGAVENRARILASRRAQSRLPVEVLAEIFLQSVLPKETLTPQMNSMPGLFGDRLKQSPWSISQVCGRWRNIALSTPAIWRYTFIDLRCLSSSNISHASSQLAMHFQRSSPLSLFLTVTVPAEYDSSFFHEILKSSPRWETFNIFMASPGPITDLAAVNGSIPRLKSLHLGEVEEGVMLDFDAPELGGFQDAPNLLVVSNVIYYLPICLPWSQLCHYRNKGVYVHDVAQHVQHMQSLVTLDLLYEPWYTEFFPPEDYPPLSPCPIVLPSLTKVRLVEEVMVLGSITAPALDSLEILCCPYVEGHMISKFILRSSCPLRSLTISKLTTPDWEWELLDILRAAPSIEHLSLSGLTDVQCEIVTRDMKRRRSTTYQANILPNLRSLSVFARDAKHFCFHSFLAMVSTRVRSCAPHSKAKPNNQVKPGTCPTPPVYLEDVRLFISTFPTFTELEQVRELLETGVKLAIDLPEEARPTYWYSDSEE